MKWLVHTDHIANKAFFHGNALRFKAGEAVKPPSDVLEELKAHPKAKMFRLYDDDGELCCTGICVGLDEADGDAAFAPLDELQGYFGCTSMQYKEGNQWKEL